MNKNLKATHDGVLNINNVELNVAVLEDDTRIITHSAVFMALGREARGNARVINKIEYTDISGRKQSKSKRDRSDKAKKSVKNGI